MPVDSFRFLPRILRALYESEQVETKAPIPWTPFPGPLTDCMFGLITSGGLYVHTAQSPFNLEREQTEPTWGDPSFRAIPVGIAQEAIRVSHLHLNTQDIERDFNILLPIHRFEELVREKKIRALAERAYSFMGYQGTPPNIKAWEEIYAPRVIKHLRRERVDCLFLTTA